MRSAFALVFFAHVLGCFFYMLGSQNPDANWLASYSAPLVDADVETRYVVSLYWAMVSVTTMGYGDIKPVTQDERLFCIMVGLVGAVVFSYCMGIISSLISQVSANAKPVIQSK